MTEATQRARLASRLQHGPHAVCTACSSLHAFTNYHSLKGICKALHHTVKSGYLWEEELQENFTCYLSALFEC